MKGVKTMLRVAFYRLCEHVKAMCEERTDVSFEELFKKTVETFPYKVTENAFRDACRAIGLNWERETPSQNSSDDQTEQSFKEQQKNIVALADSFGLLTERVKELELEQEIGFDLFESTTLPYMAIAVIRILRWIDSLDELDDGFRAVKNDFERVAKDLICPIPRELSTPKLEAVVSSQKALCRILRLSDRKVKSLVKRGMPHTKGSCTGSGRSEPGRYDVREIIDWGREYAPELNAHWDFLESTSW